MGKKTVQNAIIEEHKGSSVALDSGEYYYEEAAGSRNGLQNGEVECTRTVDS